MIKNKLKGFTLAEVLITLGIIGVVAALSAPGLIQHAASAKIGPSFARSVSTLEQALQAYMLDNDSDTLLGADPVNAKKPQKLFEQLVKDDFKKVKMTTGGAKKDIHKAIASNEVEVDSTKITSYLLNDNSAVYVSASDCDPTGTTTPCKLWILPTGYAAKKHLAIGEDAFEVAYDNHGSILIYGLDYGDSCDDPKSISPGESRKACGGRIAKMGFKKDF